MISEHSYVLTLTRDEYIVLVLAVEDRADRLWSNPERHDDAEKAFALLERLAELEPQQPTRAPTTTAG